MKAVFFIYKSREIYFGLGWWLGKFRKLSQVEDISCPLQIRLTVERALLSLVSTYLCPAQFFAVDHLSALGPWRPWCLTHYCMSGKAWIPGFPLLFLHLLQWLCMLRPMYRGKNHLPLSTTGINFPCQSNLSDKIFTEKGAVSLIPKKDTR